MLVHNARGPLRPHASGYAVCMDLDRTVAEARLKGLHSEILRGMALAALRNAEEVHEEAHATLAEIAQRRRADARLLGRLSAVPRRSEAQR